MSGSPVVSGGLGAATAVQLGEFLVHLLMKHVVERLVLRAGHRVGGNLPGKRGFGNESVLNLFGGAAVAAHRGPFSGGWVMVGVRRQVSRRRGTLDRKSTRLNSSH